MSVRRTLPRMLASLGLLGVLTAVAVASAGAPHSDEAAEAPRPVAPVGIVGLDPLAEDDEPAEEEPTPDDEPEAGAPPAPGAPASPGSVVEAAPGFSVQIRTPESSAQVAAAIAAYRAGRGLPAFLTSEPSGHTGCVWGPGGSIFPGDAPASESLGAAVIRRMPGAAGYVGPAGTVAVAVITTTSYLAPDGVEYAGQTATILTKHCIVGGVTPPPPAVPSPPPVPPVEPPPPPVEPSTPPSVPEPAPTP